MSADRPGDPADGPRAVDDESGRDQPPTAKDRAACTPTHESANSRLPGDGSPRPEPDFEKGLQAFKDANASTSGEQQHSRDESDTSNQQLTWSDKLGIFSKEFARAAVEEKPSDIGIPSQTTREAMALAPHVAIVAEAYGRDVLKYGGHAARAAGEKAEDFADGVKVKAEKLADGIKVKAEGFADGVKEKTEKFADGVIEKAEGFADGLKEKTNDVTGKVGAARHVTSEAFRDDDGRLHSVGERVHDLLERMGHHHDDRKDT